MEIVIKNPKDFCFDLPKGDDENLKDEIELIMKSNESLAEIIIKNVIEQLLLKHEHGNNIHEHREQHNEEDTYNFPQLVTNIRLRFR